MAYLVCQGDLRRTACDAWYLPCDFDHHVAEYWRADDAALRSAVETARRKPVERWGERGTRVQPLVLDDQRRAVPVLAAIPVRGTTDWAYHRETLRQFVEVALTLRRPPHMPLVRPTRRLFAIPLIGSGRSGANPLKGSYINGLLDTLDDIAAPEFDILLVINDAATFSAVQAVRKRRGRASELGDVLAAKAAALGERARTGKLVLFTGAGTGIPAGLPSWNELLTELAAPHFDISPGGRFQQLGNLDKAELVAAALGETFIDEVAGLLDVPHWSPAHSLLASLPTREHVTLNYDELFEKAAAACGRDVAVLPYQAAADRWLLKLHGCVSAERRSDIVLTRTDYLSLSSHRAALTGIVQALLVTRHMLFVGFGLGDDHLHAVIHDVRRALGDQRDGPFGTALLLDPDPLQKQLWERDLEYVAMEGEEEAPRRLELFLDLMLQEATSTAAHLFDPRFSDVLTDDELALRDALGEHVFNRPHGDSPAWELVESLGTQLGWLGLTHRDRR